MEKCLRKRPLIHIIYVLQVKLHAQGMVMISPKTLLTYYVYIYLNYHEGVLGNIIEDM